MIIKVNQRSKERIEKAKCGVASTVGPKSKTRLKDDHIRDLWIELYSYPSLSVKAFLDELYQTDTDKSFTWINMRKCSTRSIT